MKPSIPKGTRDFGPEEMKKRKFIFSVIEKHFRLYGFSQIETPAMENVSTLMGKYGEEGDRLIFKILNSGINDSKEKENLRKEFDRMLDSPYTTEHVTEKALRYDLTVPFARFVVQHRNEITFPFKRYQIQPVWRADRPQKGRYREFYQCDADVIGSDSLLNEIELVQMMQDVYNELKIPVVIKMNNRKVLTGISEVIEAPEKIIDITVAIDKLEKIGLEKVIEELNEKGLSKNSIEKLLPLFNIKGDNNERLSQLENYLSTSQNGLKGIEEIREILNDINLNSEMISFEIDLTLARGLNYYTGSIFEVKTNKGDFKGSILGGGRYDDLTGIFGVPGLSGVGISFGIDRTYDVMEELNLFNSDEFKDEALKVLFANFGKDEASHCLKLAKLLRASGLSCEIYPSTTKKIQKQFEYAEKKGIPYIIFVGSDEINSRIYPIKNIGTGNQINLNIEEIINKLKSEN
ncbi:MAG: histidine--tRNA ligase [Bacteroidota bacterium]